MLLSASWFEKNYFFQLECVHGPQLTSALSLSDTLFLLLLRLGCEWKDAGFFLAEAFKMDSLVQFLRIAAASVFLLLVSTMEQIKGEPYNFEKYLCF